MKDRSEQEVLNQAEPLTVADRCERCGAQAYVRTDIGGIKLLWCGHHFAQNEAKLREQASFVGDERHILATQEGRSMSSAPVP